MFPELAVCLAWILVYSLFSAKIYTTTLPCPKGNLLEVATICVILKINGDYCFSRGTPASSVNPWPSGERTPSLPSAAFYWSLLAFYCNLLPWVSGYDHHNQYLPLITQNTINLYIHLSVHILQQHCGQTGPLDTRIFLTHFTVPPSCCWTPPDQIPGQLSWLNAI